MKVRLTVDLYMENRNLAAGEVTEISDLSGRLLIRKGQAIEYHEPAGFSKRETATINDKTVDKHIHGSDDGKRKHGKRKGTSKG